MGGAGLRGALFAGLLAASIVLLPSIAGANSTPTTTGSTTYWGSGPCFNVRPGLAACSVLWGEPDAHGFPYVSPWSYICPGGRCGCTYGWGYSPDDIRGGNGLSEFADCLYCPPGTTLNSYVTPPVCDYPGECLTDADCDDHRMCNGDETCVNQSCQPGVPMDCDDQRTCTIDRCDAVHDLCATEIDVGACECPGPEPIRSTIEVGAPPYTFPSLSCMALPGSASASGELSASMSFTDPSCTNGCEGNGNGSGKVELSATLCSGTWGPASGSGGGSVKRQQELDCEESTCEQGCSSKGCATTMADGSVSVTGRPVKKFEWGTAHSAGPLSFEIKCAGGLSGTLTTTAGYGSTRDEGAGCADCTNLDVSLSGTASLGGSCSLGAEGPARVPEVNVGSEVEGGFSFSLTETGAVNSQWGACETESCVSVRVDAKAALKAKVAFSYGWWAVSGDCSRSSSGCSEANSCGRCSCQDCQHWENNSTECTVTRSLRFPE